MMKIGSNTRAPQKATLVGQAKEKVGECGVFKIPYKVPTSMLYTQALPNETSFLFPTVPLLPPQW